MASLANKTNGPARVGWAGLSVRARETAGLPARVLVTPFWASWIQDLLGDVR